MSLEYVTRTEYESRHAEVIELISANSKQISILLSKVSEMEGQAGLYKRMIPLLTGAIGFLAGTIVSLFAAGLIH